MSRGEYRVALACCTALAWHLQTMQAAEAQTTPNVASPIASNAEDSATGLGTQLEEVVVTAQKRTESAQKASLALDVVQADAFESEGIKNAIDLQDIVPTVHFIAADQMVVQIRGLGTNNDNPGVDSAVGYSEDGVYLAHPPALTPVLFDLQRVEVLLGPQGTLYGRNTNGGVINFISNDPSTTGLSGYAKIGGGNYSAINSEAAINLPLSDKWALRLSEGSEKHSGYSADGTNDVDAWGARAKLLFLPTDYLAFKLTLDGGKRDSLGQGYGGQCPPGNVAPGCAGVTWVPWSGFSPRAAGLINDDSIFGGSLDINADLGWAELTSITAYRGYSMQATTAPSAAPDGTANFLYSHPNHSHAVTQEVRLASQASDRLKWVAGVYYSHESEPAYVRFDYFQNTILQALYGLPPDYWQQLTTTRETDRSAAVFGDVTVPVTDRFRVRAGLRYTNEQKNAGGQIDSGATNVFVTPTQYTSAAQSTSKVTWKAGVDYDLTPENLLYATVSTGFKSGGLNNLPAAANLTTYKPETITAYEVGSKNRFDDGRVQVNLSVFRYNYKDYQTMEFYQPTGGSLAGSTLFPTVNSQTATFEGGELQAAFAVTAVDRVTAELDVLHDVFNSFVIALPYSPVVNLSNTDVPLTPRSAVSLAYEHVFELGNAGDLTVAADAHYSDHYLATGNEGPTTASALYTQPSYTKINANLSWHSREGGWTVSAFVRNMTNRATINTVAGGYPTLSNFTLVNAMVDPPRTFGASVQKDF